jgi:hypothetical protein
MDAYQVLSEPLSAATDDAVFGAGAVSPLQSVVETVTKVVETGDEGRSGLLLGQLAL